MLEMVNYGVDWSKYWGQIVMNNGLEILFSYSQELNYVNRIDERNLINCKYLNLCFASSLMYLEVKHLVSL